MYRSIKFAAIHDVARAVEEEAVEAALMERAGRRRSTRAGGDLKQRRGTKGGVGGTTIKDLVRRRSSLARRFTVTPPGPQAGFQVPREGDSADISNSGGVVETVEDGVPTIQGGDANTTNPRRPPVRPVQPQADPALLWSAGGGGGGSHRDNRQPVPPAALHAPMGPTGTSGRSALMLRLSRKTADQVGEQDVARAPPATEQQ